MENDLINDWILDADTCFDFASLFFASSALEFREARRKEWISNFMSWWDIFIVMNKVVETECRVVPLLPLHFTSITSKPLKKHHFEFEIFCRQFIIFSSLNNNTKTHIWQYFTRYGFEFKWRNPNRNGIFNYLIPCTYLIDQSFFFPELLKRWLASNFVAYRMYASCPPHFGQSLGGGCHVACWRLSLVPSRQTQINWVGLIDAGIWNASNKMRRGQRRPCLESKASIRSEIQISFHVTNWEVSFGSTLDVLTAWLILFFGRWHESFSPYQSLHACCYRNYTGEERGS